MRAPGAAYLRRMKNNSIRHRPDGKHDHMLISDRYHNAEKDDPYSPWKIVQAMTAAAPRFKGPRGFDAQHNGMARRWGDIATMAGELNVAASHKKPIAQIRQRVRIILWVELSCKKYACSSEKTSSVSPPGSQLHGAEPCTGRRRRDRRRRSSLRLEYSPHLRPWYSR